MIGLGNKLTKTYAKATWATQFLSFDGSNDKAQLTLNESIRTQLSGTNDSTDDIHNNITISMWVKPTWQFDESGANFIGLFILGDDSTVHEGIRLFYQFENGAGTFQNRLWGEARSDAGSNLKQTDYATLSDNNSITGTGTGSADSVLWDVNNVGNTNDNGLVNLVWTRGTGDWDIYWNGNAMTMVDGGNDTLSTDESQYDILELGTFSYQSSFHKYGVRDLAIFNRNLDATQIAELYNSGKFFDVRKHSAAEFLVYYCPLETDGTELIAGNDLTITGATFTSL